MINNLGNFIREIRGNVSLREFAKKISISHTHLDTIEKGIDFRTGKRVSITLDTFGRLAIALNTPLIDLLKLAADDSLIPKASFEIRKYEELLNRGVSRSVCLVNRIKLLREEKGLTQVQLGKLLNVKDAAISKYESETIQLTEDTLKKLSEIFNVSIDYILGTSSERDNKNFQQPNIIIPPKREKLVNDICAIDDETAQKIQQYLNYLKAKKEQASTA